MKDRVANAPGAIDVRVTGNAPFARDNWFSAWVLSWGSGARPINWTFLSVFVDDVFVNLTVTVRFFGTTYPLSSTERCRVVGVSTKDIDSEPEDLATVVVVVDDTK